MVLVIMGIVKLQDGASVGNVLMKVGMGVVLACWAILAVWTLLSFRSSQEYATSGLPADGTKVGAISIPARIQLTADSCSTGLRRPFHSSHYEKYLLRAHPTGHRLASPRPLRSRFALVSFLRCSPSSSSWLRAYAHVVSQISFRERRNECCIKWRIGIF